MSDRLTAKQEASADSMFKTPFDEVGEIAYDFQGNPYRFDGDHWRSHPEAALYKPWTLKTTIPWIRQEIGRYQERRNTRRLLRGLKSGRLRFVLGAKEAERIMQERNNV